MNLNFWDKHKRQICSPIGSKDGVPETDRVVSQTGTMWRFVDIGKI